MSTIKAWAAFLFAGLSTLITLYAVDVPRVVVVVSACVVAGLGTYLSPPNGGSLTRRE